VKSSGDRRLAESPEGCPGHQRADRISRRAVPAELYENILSKGNSGRNEAGAGRSSRSEVETACSQSSPQGAEGGNSQQKRYEKCGLKVNSPPEVPGWCGSLPRPGAIPAVFTDEDGEDEDDRIGERLYRRLGPDPDKGMPAAPADFREYLSEIRRTSCTGQSTPFASSVDRKAGETSPDLFRMGERREEPGSHLLLLSARRGNPVRSVSQPC